MNNPSFEDSYTCNIALGEIYKAKCWSGLDSTQYLCGGDYYNACSTNINSTTVPSNVFSFQFAKTGSAYGLCGGFYCPPPNCAVNNQRSYLRNRLKNTLLAGVTYCVKMNVNLINKCKYGIDALHIYLADASADTISTCNVPLTYITPQITNTLGIISDTLNWIEVSGTFTANGSEKYLVIGNFLPNSSVNTSTVNSSQPGWSTYNIDDVSVIDYNLPAYAGPDKNINLGDSAFIGRPPEIGLECTWTTGTTTVGSGGGIWVKPTSLGTYSYVVTQNICGNIKTDTVFVNMSSGVDENIVFAQSIGIYPQPAKDLVNINFSNYYEPTVEIRITNVNGSLIQSSELAIKNGKTQIDTQQLSDGVYFLQLQNSKGQISNKKLIISR